MLQSVFNIRSGEAAKVGIMFLYSLFIVGGVYTIGRALVRIGSQPEAVWLKELCHAPEEAVRSEAIDAYCTLNKEQTLEYVLPFLQEPGPATKQAALVGLIRYGGLDGILPAVEQLKNMVSSPQPEMRLEVARALGALQIPTFYQPLLTLLDDPERQIQIEAIRAAGALKTPALAPYVIHLLGQLKESDRQVRGAIFAALTRLRDAGVTLEIKKELISEALMLEFGYYYQVYVWRVELNPEDHQPGSLLDEALSVRLAERLERIFFLLELLYSVKTIEAINVALKAKEGLERANAIELLDNLVDREIKMLLLPLIEAPVEQVLEIARQRFGISRLSQPARLAQLVGYPDTWLASCAIFEIGRLGPTDLTEPVLAALNSEHELVRETALVACRQLLNPNHYRQILAAQTVLAEFPQVRQYAQALLQQYG
jgi:HEAT repeat protein